MTSEKCGHAIKLVRVSQGFMVIMTLRVVTWIMVASLCGACNSSLFVISIPTHTLTFTPICTYTCRQNMSEEKKGKKVQWEAPNFPHFQHRKKSYPTNKLHFSKHRRKLPKCFLWNSLFHLASRPLVSLIKEEVIQTHIKEATDRIGRQTDRYADIYNNEHILYESEIGYTFQYCEWIR